MGKLVGGEANDESRAHGTVSSEGKLSPEMSGTRSELRGGQFPCLLGGCE